MSVFSELFASMISFSASVEQSTVDCGPHAPHSGNVSSRVVCVASCRVCALVANVPVVITVSAEAPGQSGGKSEA